MKQRTIKLQSVLCLLLIVAALSACNRKPESAGQESTKSADTAKQPEPSKAIVQPTVFSQNGIEIEYKVREPRHILDRFGFVKDLVPSDYVAWKMNAGGVFGQMVAEFDRSPDRHYVEVLLLITNKAGASKVFDIVNVFLENGPEQILPWECLPGNAFDSYAELAHYVGLSEGAPLNDTTVTFNTEPDHKWRGKFYTLLNAGQKAWVDLIFFLPKTLHNTKLHFGPKGWEPIDVAI